MDQFKNTPLDRNRENINLSIKISLNYIFFQYPGVLYCKAVYSFIALLIMLLISGQKTTNNSFSAIKVSTCGGGRGTGLINVGFKQT